MSDTTRNILLLNSIERTVWGGLEHWMEMVGRGLARRGHRIRFAGRSGSHFLRRLSDDDEFDIIPLEISGDFNPFTIKALADVVRGDMPDMMLCNFVKDVRLAGLTRTLTEPYKIVWTPGVNLARKSFSHKWLFANFVDRIIVPSAHLRDEIVRCGYIDRSKFDVVPIGIDPDRWRGDRDESRAFLLERFNLPDDAFICLTSGRFVPQKGHCHLIEAARELAERHENIFFLLLGNGPLEADLVEQIKGYGLTDRFVFCGLLDNHRKAVFGADVYVHPAIIEPYGIVLVEAMAAGLPVAATRVGGIPEVVEENETALLVDAADAGQLTQAVERFYTEETLRESFGRRGYERFDRLFRMESMIDRIETSLSETAGA